MNNTLKINYRTSSGSGRFEISLAVFPCSVHDFNIILGMVNRSDDPAAHVEMINGYFMERVEMLKIARAACDPETEKKDIAEFTAIIKKYISLNAVLVKNYGVEEITDNEAKIKLQAATVYALRLNKDREQVAEAFEGWIFTKGGYTFEAFKDGDGKTATYIIMVKGTGLKLADTSKKSEIIASVTPRLLDILSKNAAKLDEARAIFKKHMINAGFIEADDTNEGTNENSNESTNENTSENSQNKEGENMKANTNKNYFSGVKNLEDLRKVYRDLLKANHPDNGGSTEATQAINAAYKEAFDLLKSGAKLDDEKEKLRWSEAEDAAIREALYKVIHLDGLNIEIIGCWIWIDGNTYNAREALKDAGFAWSKARHKWHFAPYEKKYYKGSKKPFEKLREMYGSQEVESEKTEKITE